MDAEITALEVKFAKARQIKQGMMQKLLTGSIRLVEQTIKMAKHDARMSGEEACHTKTGKNS